MRISLTKRKLLRDTFNQRPTVRIVHNQNTAYTSSIYTACSYGVCTTSLSEREAYRTVPANEGAIQKQNNVQVYQHES